VDGILYKEFFISDYYTNLYRLQNLGEYEGIDELNHLATLLSEMNEWELEVFEAAAKHGGHSGSVKDLINLTKNLDCYEYYPDVNDYGDLGHYLIDGLGYEEVPERLENYFDYDAYGRNYVDDENGEFINGGFVFRNDVGFREHYDGQRTPEEYRIFAYPDPPGKMRIKDQLEMFGKMAAGQLAADRTAPVRDERA
jgi:hypothetical protein